MDDIIDRGELFGSISHHTGGDNSFRRSNNMNNGVRTTKRSVNNNDDDVPFQQHHQKQPKVYNQGKKRKRSASLMKHKIKQESDSVEDELLKNDQFNLHDDMTSMSYSSASLPTAIVIGPFGAKQNSSNNNNSIREPLHKRVKRFHDNNTNRNNENGHNNNTNQSNSEYGIPISGRLLNPRIEDVTDDPAHTFDIRSKHVPKSSTTSGVLPDDLLDDLEMAGNFSRFIKSHPQHLVIPNPQPPVNGNNNNNKMGEANAIRYKNISLNDLEMETLYYRKEFLTKLQKMNEPKEGENGSLNNEGHSHENEDKEDRDLLQTEQNAFTIEEADGDGDGGGGEMTIEGQPTDSPKTKKKLPSLSENSPTRTKTMLEESTYQSQGYNKLLKLLEPQEPSYVKHRREERRIKKQKNNTNSSQSSSSSSSSSSSLDNDKDSLNQASQSLSSAESLDIRDNVGIEDEQRLSDSSKSDIYIQKQDFNVTKNGFQNPEKCSVLTEETVAYVKKKFGNELKNANMDVKTFLAEICPLCAYGNRDMKGHYMLEIEKIKEIDRTKKMSMTPQNLATMLCLLWNSRIYIPLKNIGVPMLPFLYDIALDHVRKPHKMDNKLISKGQVEDILIMQHGLKEIMFAIEEEEEEEEKEEEQEDVPKDESEQPQSGELSQETKREKKPARRKKKSIKYSSQALKDYILLSKLAYQWLFSSKKGGMFNTKRNSTILNTTNSNYMIKFAK